MQHSDRPLPVVVLDRHRELDASPLAGPIQDAPVEPRQKAAVGIRIRGHREPVHGRKRRAFGCRDHQSQSRGTELAEIVVEPRCSGHQPASRREILRRERAEALRLGAALVAVVDEDAEAFPDHRQRDTQLDAIPLVRRLPGAFDARLVDDFPPAELELLDASRTYSSRSQRREEDLPLEAVCIGEAEPDAVTERLRVEEPSARRVEHEPRVLHVEQHEEHPLVHAREHAQPIVAAGKRTPGVGAIRPVVRVAVEKRCAGKWKGLQIERAQRTRTHPAPIEQLFTPLERSRDGLRHRLQCLLLAPAQHALHLAHVLAARPGQHEGREPEKQEFEAQRHGSALHSIHR